MEHTKTLLPNVMHLLSQSPNLSATVTDLAEQLKDVNCDNTLSPYKSVQKAVRLGVDLGILSRNGRSVVLPFGLKPKPSQIKNTTRSPAECRRLKKRMLENMKSIQTMQAPSTKIPSISKKARAAMKVRGPSVPIREIRRSIGPSYNLSHGNLYLSEHLDEQEEAHID